MEQNPSALEWAKPVQSNILVEIRTTFYPHCFLLQAYYKINVQQEQVRFECMSFKSHVGYSSYILFCFIEINCHLQKVKLMSLSFTLDS